MDLDQVCLKTEFLGLVIIYANPVFAGPKVTSFVGVFPAGNDLYLATRQGPVRVAGRPDAIVAIAPGRRGQQRYRSDQTYRDQE